MKAVGVISTTVMFLLLAYAVPAFAQEEHHEDAKPEHQDEKAKPAQHQEQAKPAQHEEQAKPQEHQAEAKKQAPEAKPAKHEEQAKPQEHQAEAKKQAPEAKPAKQQQQAKPAQHQEQAKSEEHGRPERSASEQQHQRQQPALRLSARGSARIPDDRFRANFGHDHTFVIREPVIVGGYSRFQYGGFWFGFVNPWPVGWYYTDNVYVDYVDGGYYLYNPYYPGARVSLSVVL
ncbi:MAG: hypothetical protein WA193_00985 [Candidatus Acidiferrales bacterium]